MTILKTNNTLQSFLFSILLLCTGNILVWQIIPWQSYIFSFLLFSLYVILLSINNNSLKYRLGLIDYLVIIYFFIGGLILVYNRSSGYIEELINLVSYLFIYLLIRGYANFSVLSNALTSVAFLASIQYIIFHLLRIDYFEYGWVRYQGILGIFLAICLPISLHNVCSQKWCFFIFPIVIFFALILTESRTAFLSELFAGFLYVLLRKRAFFIKKKVLFCTVVLAILGISVGLCYLRTESINGRLLVWKISKPMLEWKTITFGKGIGYFKNQYLSYQSCYFSSAKRPINEILTVDEVRVLFNDFYQIFIERGLLGVILFLAICYYSILQGKNLWIRFSLIIFLFSSICSYPFSSNVLSIVFYILLAQLASTVEVQKYLSFSYDLFIKRLLIISALLCVFLNSYYIYHLNKWRLLRTQLWVYNESSMWRKYNQLFPYLSSNPNFVLDFGEKLQQLSYLQEAQLYLNSIANNIPNERSYLIVGHNYQLRGNIDSAAIYYSKAIYTNPKKIKARRILFNLYKQNNMTDKAISTALEALKVPTKIPSKYVDSVKNEMKVYIKLTAKKHIN